MMSTNVVSCGQPSKTAGRPLPARRKQTLKVGLDVGSTTIKCVVLDDADNLIYSTYERHYSHIVEKSEELLRRAAERYVPAALDDFG